jgi:hypothetical protein
MKNILNAAKILAIAALSALASCNQGESSTSQDKQGKDGVPVTMEGIELRIAEAELIQVDNKPEYNTAEWQFRIDKPGRYDVWLSSLTIDTTQLHFEDMVIITAGETTLEKKPLRDEIVTEDKSVQVPWYRADSHMGSIFFPNPGEYQVQVISNKVFPHSTDLSQLGIDKQTLINSLILKPIVN